MGILDKTLTRLRDLLSSDKEQLQALNSKSAMATDLAGSPYDVLQRAGMEAVSDYLRLDYDLVSKYTDFEVMDDYGEVASVLDVYADETTQPDTPRNQRVWVESPDAELKQLLNDLLHRTLRIEEDLWPISRTACKYGSTPEEIMVGEEGVVALGSLPTYSMRRVEGVKGELYGFVQSFNREASFTPQDYQQLLAQQQSGKKTDPLAYAQNPVMGQTLSLKSTSGLGPIAFEPWQIAHFRMPGRQRRSMYGSCVPAATRVWTTDGVKAIVDVKVGDRVYCRHAGLLRSTPVLNHVCNGTKEVLSLRTKHREVFLTANHPVLVERSGRNEWVLAGEIRVGEAICISTNQPESISPPPFGVVLSELTDDLAVRLTTRGQAALKAYLRRSNAPHGTGLSIAFSGIATKSQQETILSGAGSITLAELRTVFAEVGIPLFDGAFTVAHDAHLTLPDFVEPWLARLFGFLLGDGWLTDSQIWFARGVDEPTNAYYEGLLSRLGLRVGITADRKQSSASSKAVVGLLRKLGWTDGAHNKRVPSWVFGCSREIREEFIAGFCDADGWTTREGRYHHIELCNEALLRDLKNLIDGLGWISGNIRRRGPRVSHLTDGRVVSGGFGYLLFFHKDMLGTDDFVFEKVVSTTYRSTEPVYDIEVADDGHNFVAEGVVLHNSVLDSARWIWKRLVLLEDAALIYRLQRSPERYAFYVDVGNRPIGEAMKLLNLVRQQYRKRRFINPQSGQVDLKMETIAQLDDFFIPVVNGAESTRIETLSSPSWQHMEDIEYFLNKFYTAVLAPKAYFMQDEGYQKPALTSNDIRFARTILRSQQGMTTGVEKICRVHLAALGIPPDAVEFDVKMAVPSSIFELAQLEVRNARADFAERVRNDFPQDWILRNVYGCSEDEIEVLIAKKKKETAAQMGGGGFGEAKEFKSIRQEKETTRKLEQMLQNDATMSRRVRAVKGLLEEMRATSSKSVRKS